MRNVRSNPFQPFESVNFFNAWMQFSAGPLWMILISFLISSLPSISRAQLSPQDLSRISPQLKFLAQIENRFNPAQAHESSDQPFLIEHFEIPQRLVENLMTSDVPAAILKALIFEKNGEPWVRWIPNPDDTAYKPELMDFLRKNGVATEPQRRFIGFRTASRSVLVFDPETGSEFSVKASTNNTRGQWSEKPETSAVARAVTLVSKYVSKLLPQMDNSLRENVLVCEEPGGFAIKAAGIDQGMLIRTYPFSKGKLLVPLFAVFHEDFGKKLAAANGYSRPLSFVKEKVFPLWLKSIVRFSVMTGFMSNSAHGQNYLLEVDESLRLTGRVLHRDFADARVNAIILERNQAPKELLEIFQGFAQKNETNEVLRPNAGDLVSLKIYFSPAHSNLLNSWFPDGLRHSEGIPVYQLVKDTIEKELRTALAPALNPWVHLEVSGEAGLAFSKAEGRYITQLPFAVRIWETQDAKRPNTVVPFVNFPKSRMRSCQTVHAL